MKVERINENHIRIYPEEDGMEEFKKSLGWTDKKELISIICELKGYEVD